MLLFILFWLIYKSISFYESPTGNKRNRKLLCYNNKCPTGNKYIKFLDKGIGIIHTPEYHKFMYQSDEFSLLALFFRQRLSDF